MMQDDDLAKVPIDEEKMALDQEMKKLTITERDNAEQAVLGYSATAMNILKGVSRYQGNSVNSIDGLVEDGEFLSQKFRELESAINAIEAVGSSGSDPDLAAYQLARDKDEIYVNHPLFRIGFLRAARYDAQSAARRMMRYIREKLDLFGIEKLVRDIIISDLGDDGRRYLERGGLQIMPERDTAGRRVVFMTSVLDETATESDYLSARKAYFYFFSSLAEDDDERGKIKGIVGILWRVHNPPVPNFAFADALRQIWQCAPTKLSAYHMCYGRKTSINLQTLNMFARMSLAWSKSTQSLRIRRAHYGEAVEIMYTLLTTYGCPTHCFPLNHESPGHKFPSLETAGRNENLAMVTLFHDHHVKKWLAHREYVDDIKQQMIDSLASSKSGSRFSLGFINSLNSDISMGNSFSFNGSICDSLIGGKRQSLGSSMGTGDSLMGGNAEQKEAERTKAPVSMTSSGSRDSIRLSDMSIGSVGSLFKANDDSLGKILNESLETLVGIDALEATHVDAPKGAAVSRSKKGLIRDSDVRPEDIKLGRGKPLQRHPGNIWFRKFVASHYSKYEALEKRQQTELSKEIVRQIRDEGRRILKRNKDTPDEFWVEVDDSDAREKVAFTFRTERKNRDKKRKAEESESRQ